MSYEGPGLYRHYKGGIYTAIDVAEHESTGQRLVIYDTHSIDHKAERLGRGAGLIARPLDIEDGRDAWNEMVGDPRVPRFVKLDET